MLICEINTTAHLYILQHYVGASFSPLYPRERKTSLIVSRRKSIARALLAHGADPFLTTSEGETLYHFLAQSQGGDGIHSMWKKYRDMGVPLGRLSLSYRLNLTDQEMASPFSRAQQTNTRSLFGVRGHPGHTALIAYLTGEISKAPVILNVYDLIYRKVCCVPVFCRFRLPTTLTTLQDIFRGVQQSNIITGVWGVSHRT